MKRLALAIVSTATLVIVACSDPGSSPTTEKGPWQIRYEVTNTSSTPADTPAFISYGDPSYATNPAGATYTTPWAYEFTAQSGQVVFLYVKDVYGTAGVPDTVTMKIYKDGVLADTYSFVNNTGSPASHMLNPGAL